ncbi:hypothetical protein [Agreia sp. COWG]|uniref:hypothetical protein n=1 Tax=Agreia sp. COWG TaxID=2773266 RepID=UPI0019275D1A|nr:hypothetical protein [Agreia sp. COWG]CAD6003467.1 protein of unknown function [Agreia sp. COWG]
MKTIAHAGIGQTVKIKELHAARYLDARLELTRERQIAHERTIHPGMGLSR